MKIETGYKCIVLDNEHGRSYYDAVKETWCKGVVVLTQKTVDAVLPKLKSKEIIAPLISVIDDPRFSKCCCESECETSETLGTSNCCPIHNVNPHACYASPKCIPTPSHSEETETTEKEWTYVIGSEGCTVRHHDKPKFYELTINEAIEICDKFNSYSTLKAENERLEQEVKAYRNEEKYGVERYKELQSDNEAKEKRIQEQQRLIGIAHYFIGQLNVLEFTSEQSARAKEIYSQLQSALTQ